MERSWRDPRTAQWELSVVRCVSVSGHLGLELEKSFVGIVKDSK